MNQFNEAVLKGLRAAEKAAKDLAEIRNAVTEMSEAVEVVSKGAVGIKIATDKREVTRSLMEAALKPLEKRYESFRVIAAYRTDKQESKRVLADIELTEDGFPCKVKLGTRDYVCHDIKSFVSVLKELLVSSSTGRAIVELQAEFSADDKDGSKNVGG